MPDRSPKWPPTTRSSCRRSSGREVVKGIALDDIAEYINETALFRNQWQFRPEKGEGEDGRADAEFKDRLRPQLREQLAAGQGRRACSCRRSSTATSRPTATATTSSSGRTTAARPSGCGSRSPARTRSRASASPTSSGPRRRRGRLRRVPHRHDGRARLRGDRNLVRGRQVPGLPDAARAGRRDGRGAGRVLAPAHPRGVGLRRRGRSLARWSVPPAVPRRPLLVGLSRPVPTSRTT